MMFDNTVQEVMDKVNDLRHKVDDFWGVPAAEARFLAQLVRLGRSQSICEIGASYGYSTLHLAAAASEHGGHVHTIDIDQRKIDIVRSHLEQAGLYPFVTVHHGDAREVLAAMRAQSKFDFVFIDAVKDQCHAYLQAVWPLLASPAVIVTDNITTHAKELEGFVSYLRNHPSIRSCGVAVGNGIELSIHRQ